MAVLFAYGYNDAAFLEETKALIRERFHQGDDLVKDEDIMMALTFPDDFQSSRISLLYDKIYDKTGDENLSALVLLGSPERTHEVLARLQDTWEVQGGAIPVVSLFSQDNVLGTEAGSDVAVDFVPLPEAPALAEDTEAISATRRIPPDTLVHILEELHRRAVEEPSPLLAPEKGTVEALFGPGYAVTSYRDTETGLIAEKHFLVDFGGAP